MEAARTVKPEHATMVDQISTSSDGALCKDESRNVATAEISSIDHLRVCQDFIRKHGMAKYSETFREGLPTNIVTYTPDQRARHFSILKSIDD